VFPLWLTLVTLAVCGAGDAAAAGTNATVRLEGRVARVGSAGTNLVFQPTAGEPLALLRTPASEALFVDTNLLTRTLVLTGKAAGRSFEVTGNLRSIKDGRVHELYYYCSICAISTSAPGLCQCCREPSELREEPVETR
jgi:hypothetical protein